MYMLGFMSTFNILKRFVICLCYLTLEIGIVIILDIYETLTLTKPRCVETFTPS